MPEIRKFSLVKPSLDTPFHIDFDWWRENDRNWHVELRSLLCSEHQDSFAEIPEDELIDWIDPETAIVSQIDGFQQILIQHCAQQDGFVSERTTLVDAVFRFFLTNGNYPVSAQALGMALGRPADTILRTLAGPRVYKGLRPYNT